MYKRLTIAQHNRRKFLKVATGLVTGIAASQLTPTSLASAKPNGSKSDLASVVADLDLIEFRLSSYAQHVKKYTTAWGKTVDDWYPAFVAANADLAKNGGGRLIVEAGQYHISGHVVFDLPVVSVHLEKDSNIELVGDPDVFLGAPIGFFGNAKPDEPIENRIQRDFAAIFGPGSIGYPADQLHRYPHENGVAMSYIKTAIMEGVNVPHVPGKGVTAQFGCNDIIMRNCTIGNTFTGDAERDYGGQASIVAQGGWSFDRRTPPKWPLFTNVTVDNNIVQNEIVRGIHASFCKKVTITNNKLAPSWGAGLILKGIENVSVQNNTFSETCQGFPSKSGKPFSEYQPKDGVPESAFFFVATEKPTLKNNILLGNSHQHCVHSWQVSGALPSGRIYARRNLLTKGKKSIFAGRPHWDSDQ